MKRLVVCALSALFIAALDQYTKFAAFNYLQQFNPPYVEVTSFFNLVMVRNYGVSFGMFSNLAHGELILSGIVFFITIILCIWLVRSKNFVESLALSAVIGGAIGNLIDRVRDGSVADFLDFHYAGFHWPAFNVADIGVCCGVIVLIILSVLETKQTK